MTLACAESIYSRSPVLKTEDFSWDAQVQLPIQPSERPCECQGGAAGDAAEGNTRTGPITIAIANPAQPYEIAIARLDKSEGGLRKRAGLSSGPLCGVGGRACAQKLESIGRIRTRSPRDSHHCGGQEITEGR